eukprot:TRINITY_DN4668_c1_g1_i2.p2 TRINITY_DN4668_c1_g1~~TRINITY_DN4668_c1_g1_i2.p2  ORF type:complete len:374 (-),score=-19.34 TRINITY_DN4668_c1_g1_i2:431-1552(-)
MAATIDNACRRTQTLSDPKKRSLEVELACESETRAMKLPKYSHSEATPLSCAPVFDFHTGRIADSFAVESEPIGSGQFGVVRRCVSLQTGEAFACKTIQKVRLVTEEDRNEVRREVALMNRIAGHPGAVQLRAAFEDDLEIHLVMDLCDRGELFDEIVRRGRLSERDAARVFHTLANTVAFCHSKGVLHRDLKPENVLLSSAANGGVVAKLADFGLAVALGPNERVIGCAGSPFYMAPEVLTGPYSFEADVWSLGVILYIMLSGTTPFWGPDDNAVFTAILAGRLDMSGPAWAGVSAEARGLIRCMLSLDPRRRPSAAKVLSHPWVLAHVFGGRVVRKIAGARTVVAGKGSVAAALSAEAAGPVTAAVAAPGA